MAGFDDIVRFMVEAAKREEERKNPSPKHLGAFSFVRKAGDLVNPAKERAKHHREREQDYTKQLEAAEQELRSKGISMEIIDQATGFAIPGIIASGSVVGGSQTGSNYQTPKFTPKINLDMLGEVEKAKTKMLEHRRDADKFDKYARAFSCSPETEVILSVEDVHDFRLEG